MMKLPEIKDKRQIMAVAALIVVAVIFVYIKFLLLPQISGVVKNTAVVAKYSGEVNSAERDVAQIESLKKQIESHKAKIDSYERMLPAEQEMPKLLEDLSSMAQRSGVKIVGITPVQPKTEFVPDQIYQEKPILINARSGYHELGKFLSDLENSDRFMKVEDINVKANRANVRRHEVELLVLAYVLPNSK